MVTLSDLTPDTDSIEPSNATYNMRSARGNVQLMLRKEDGPWGVDSLKALIPLILGTTKVQNTNQTSGRLNRTLPLSHPIYDSWYASNVSEVRGVGVPTQQANPPQNPALNGAVTIPALIYPEYSVKVEFTPRLYNVLPNTAITQAFGDWYPLAGGGRQQFSYANEWVRFCDFELSPKDDWETAQAGTMTFQATATPPNGSPFAAMPRMRLPNQTLKVTWYGVPYRYITSPNSYITKWPGYINQNDWFNWKAGQLLYIGYNPIRYQPPNPEITSDGGSISSWAKLCDLELFFLLTNRTTDDTLPGPTNGNIIQAHWNLAPWYFDLHFHYPLTANGNPLWESFPVEILFFDPDVPHSGGL